MNNLWSKIFIDLHNPHNHCLSRFFSLKFKGRKSSPLQFVKRKSIRSTTLCSFKMENWSDDDISSVQSLNVIKQLCALRSLITYPLLAFWISAMKFTDVDFYEEKNNPPSCAYILYSSPLIRAFDPSSNKLIIDFSMKYEELIIVMNNKNLIPKYIPDRYIWWNFLTENLMIRMISCEQRNLFKKIKFIYHKI